MNTKESAIFEEINTLIQEYKKTEDNDTRSQLRNLIVLAYLPFLKKISKSLARRSSDPVEDLVQIGSIGLLKAIDQYNITFGTSFKTYASYFITGEIKHYLRDKGNLIRAPRELQELSFRINQIIQKLTIKLNRAPSDLEISQELEIPIYKVNEVINIERRKYTVSLDQVMSNNIDNKRSFSEGLIDNRYQDYFTIQENKIMIVEAIESLKNPLKDVIKLSFFEDLSQNEIAKRLNISQMQVSRRLKKALSELFIIITKEKKTVNEAKI